MNMLVAFLVHISLIPSVWAAGCGADGCVDVEDATSLIQTNLQALSREEARLADAEAMLMDAEFDSDLNLDTQATTLEEEMRIADAAAVEEMKQEQELKQQEAVDAQEDAKLKKEMEAALDTTFTEADMSLADQTVMQDAQTQSLMVDELFALAAKNLQDGTTKQLFESFQICGQCSSFKRFGEPHDGGYLMCMDGLDKGSTLAAYSLGVEHHDQWSEDVIKDLGLPVHQFDCTVATSDCKACTFHKNCIVAADGQHPVPGHDSEGLSLRQALEQTGMANAPEASLLMKMDIEGSEWPIYASEPPEELKKIGQLVVEFHQMQNEWQHGEMLQAMQHIQNAGFKIAHLHGNNYQEMYAAGNLAVPQVIEVTFVHGKNRPNGCLKDQRYREGLDAENKEGFPELPLAHMAE